jgi:Rrf2 family protein
MGPLKLVGLIRSTRGSNGGFALAKPPSKINMKEIVSALEGSLCLVQCVDNPDLCNRVPICVTRDIWSAASESILGVLEAITLEDMVASRKQKDQKPIASST